jgi:hypothetical protein
MSEIVFNAYQHSQFSLDEYQKHIHSEVLIISSF